jgi:hypothetical protein
MQGGARVCVKAYSTWIMMDVHHPSQGVFNMDNNRRWGCTLSTRSIQRGSIMTDVHHPHTAKRMTVITRVALCAAPYRPQKERRYAAAWAGLDAWLALQDETTHWRYLGRPAVMSTATTSGHSNGCFSVCRCTCPVVNTQTRLGWRVGVVLRV